ncbi:MAG: FAD-dependent oxidoreductase [Pseudomonadales bacterium]|nr:FAD-dependent oxidoreductase [Pseudomonadales bacterium]
MPTSASPSPHTKPKLVIAGFGDTGLLTAIYLADAFEVVGISTKPCLLSGQELGSRLTRPAEWQRDYLVAFDRFNKLDQVTIKQGLIQSVDTDQQTLTYCDAAQQSHTIGYDFLLLSPGVSNGFWRNNLLQPFDAIEASLQHHHQQLCAAKCVAVVGAGASGVSVACNLAEEQPDTQVHLFFSHPAILPGYHPKVQRKVTQRLKLAGVHLHAGYRADLTGKTQAQLNSIDHGEIVWQTPQPAFSADAIVWCVGNLQPNNQFVPKAMLNADGFIKADAHLRVPGFDNVFTVGDIAASDANRSSARNAGFMTVASNLKRLAEADRNGKSEVKLKTFKASRYRWGSILGVQASGMRVYAANGMVVRIPKALVRSILFPIIVAKGIYRGIRQQG